MAWRWIESDPLGRPVHCSEETWQRKTSQRAGLAEHEEAVRQTIRDPDAIYDDPQGTEEATNPDATVQVFFAAGRTRGQYAGTLLMVVVKWLPEGPDGREFGYVRTALFTGRVQRRLQWQWGRTLR